MTDLLDLLRPYQGAMPAFLVALATALTARLLGRAWLAAIAAGTGVLVGWWGIFGLITASPRQLPERLPLLMLALVLLTPPLVLAARRWRGLALPAAALGAIWSGWWMAGAPMTVADLTRAAEVLAGIALASLLIALRAAPRWAGPVAAAALLGGLAGAAPPGPYLLLAAALLAAATGAALVPPGRASGGPAPVAALPLAGALAALAALPLIGRGAPADWAAAAAPLLALWLGAPLGARFVRGPGAPLGAALAGAACALVAFLAK